MYIYIKFRFEQNETSEINEQAETQSVIDIETSWAEYFYNNAKNLTYKMDPPTPEQILDSDLSNYKKSYLMTKFHQDFLSKQTDENDKKAVYSGT